MIAGPEISRIINQFEVSPELDDTHHHEQKPAFQKSFKNDVDALVNVFDSFGNPFTEDSGNLLMIDSKDIMDEAVSQSLKSMKDIGLEKSQPFVKERFIDKTKSINEPISKNNIVLFSQKKQVTKTKSQVTVLREDCNLFSRLYIACQSRDGNLDEFFRHEKQPWPPSLFKDGVVRSGSKADLLSCLETQAQRPADAPQADVAIFDGAVVVQMLSPLDCKTFQEYIDRRFVPYIKQQLQNVTRLDLVWDSYRPDSLKSCTRDKRGSGVRRRVLPDTNIPGNWQSFLGVNENKTELFNLCPSMCQIGCYWKRNNLFVW